MRKIAVGALVLAILLAVAWAGKTMVLRKPDRPAQAQVARVARRDVASTVKSTGIVRPMVGAEVRVGSRASGVVKRIHVRIGDTVRKGDLLAELDTRELGARRDQAAAQLKAARANQTYGRLELARDQSLFARSIIPKSTLDLSERAAAVADTSVAEARANLAYAETQLEFARIVAPIGGTVASITMQEGETVAASLTAPTFLTILDLDRLEVWAYVDEVDIGRIQVGQQAAFTVDAYPGTEFDAKVVAIYPKAEIRDNVVNYVAVLNFTPVPAAMLRPEMTASVQIHLDRRENVLTVPRRAVRRDGGRPSVVCVDGGRRWIVTGSRDESYWEVTDGLREGDEVLVGTAASGPSSDP